MVGGSDILPYQGRPGQPSRSLQLATNDATTVKVVDPDDLHQCICESKLQRVGSD
jgi:hypothetical protein